MVLFNYSTKELTAKVVYYGPGLCGKTTNLQWIHEKLPIKNKGKMLSLATETDRTLFFDFLPIELGTIRGMKTRIQLYTVPGQVFYNATRRMVLKGADCVVFVADSQDAMLEANAESLENLKENLEINDISLEDVPLVIQYNKRDLPNALPVDQLNARLNPRGVPYYEAVAVKGVGVEETLKGVTSLVFKSLASRYGGPEGKAAASKTTVPAPNVVQRSAAAAPSPPTPVPAPPPSPPPPAPPPAPARATGAFSPSDLLEADPIEVGPDEMELDLEADSGLEELSLDELGAEPPAAPNEPPELDLELEESPPLETVEDFSPLSELEGFDPPGSASSTTSPFGAVTQPGPLDDDPLAGLGADEPAPRPSLGAETTPLGGGFDPSSLGEDDSSLDPDSLLEPEPGGWDPSARPDPQPEAPESMGWDPSALSEPDPEPELVSLSPPSPGGWDPSAAPSPESLVEPELDLPGLGDSAATGGDDQETELADLFDTSLELEAEPEPPPLEEPPLPEPPLEEPPLPEPEPYAPESDASFGFPMDDSPADDPLSGDPLSDLDFGEPESGPSGTAPVPQYSDEADDEGPPATLQFPAMPDEDDDLLSDLESDPFGEPVEAPPLPGERAADPEPPVFEAPVPEPPVPEPPEPPVFEPPAPEPPPVRQQAPRESPPPSPPPSRPAPPRPAPPREVPVATAMAQAPAVATATIERAISPTVGSVALAAGGAENDITIPVEVTLGPGGATSVNLNIRLTLNFKLQ